MNVDSRQGRDHAGGVRTLLRRFIVKSIDTRAWAACLAILCLPLLVSCHAEGQAQEVAQFFGTPAQPAPPTPQATPQTDGQDRLVAPRSQLMQAIPYPNWTMRELAADSLWRIGKPAVPALIDSLGDPDPYVRTLAAGTLAQMGPDAAEAVPTLIILLEDESESVRQHAARALGQVGPGAEQAVPALIQKLQGPRR